MIDLLTETAPISSSEDLGGDIELYNAINRPREEQPFGISPHSANQRNEIQPFHFKEKRQNIWNLSIYFVSYFATASWADQ
jgi:hypothetical protein